MFDERGYPCKNNGLEHVIAAGPAQFEYKGKYNIPVGGGQLFPYKDYSINEAQRQTDRYTWAKFNEGLPVAISSRQVTPTEYENYWTLPRWQQKDTDINNHIPLTYLVVSYTLTNFFLLNACFNPLKLWLFKNPEPFILY